ncbi:hypothetical protein NECAME_01636 [Necator americanus]|uniref:Uncharacterized protein n=1 Tax=Necator americanus TaxID=51031 RepID=W2TQT1_NECAM|nr:hypothetical protein NECAME_01636 [Necator americanus]ETN84410.1 hypothetical protein NECAME_01636 [Necator americanus]
MNCEDPLIPLDGYEFVRVRNTRVPDEFCEVRSNISSFEWVLAGYARPRESIGFHHHRIAKYEWSAEDLTAPDQFIRKVWVLRRKPEVSAILHPRARLN